MVQSKAVDAFRRWGFRRIETPAFEHTELFERGLAEGSDIVTKEMYTFLDKGGRSLTLRPDMTAPVVRAVIEHRLAERGLPVKVYYDVPVFRHERPQAGRFRQFTQVGVEAIGSQSPQLDAEVIALATEVLASVGLSQFELALNSIGHPGCRAEYLPRLVGFLRSRADQLCDDCKKKIDKNPLRTFDCKVPSDIKIMEEAPLISNSLCDDCRGHHVAVKASLSDLGVAFNESPRLVRGLDYYTRTTFEFTAAGLGSQDAVGGGGRYDGLAELIGGARMPGVGFGLGVARIAIALEAAGSGVEQRLDAYIACISEEAKRPGLLLARDLRRAGLTIDMDLDSKSIRAQFKAADRLGARRVIVIGDKELASGTVTIRDMSSGVESTVPIEEVTNEFKEID